LFPGIFWIIFIVVNALNGLWIYCFLNYEMILSGFLLLALTILLYLLNAVAFRVCWYDVTYSRDNDSEDMSHEEDIVELSHCEVVLLRLLTLNGLPLYAMWSSIATCLQWALNFRYFTFNWSDNVSCVVVLAILSGILLIYWSMELLFLRKYFVWTWLSCFVLILAFSAIISRHGVNSAATLFFIIFIDSQ
jgi:hypothetical protein